MDLEKAYNKIDNFCCSNHNTLQGNKVKYLNGREETIDMFDDYKETKDEDFCKDLNEMIDAAFVDGTISEREKRTIITKAVEMGIDPLDAEAHIASRLAELK